MITLDDYFRDSVSHFNFSPSAQEIESASDLLHAMNAMIEDFCADTGENPDDYPLSSGHRTAAKTGALQAAGYGAATSGTHTTSHGGDILDPRNKLDCWLDDTKLEGYGLYREHPAATVAGQRGAHADWCHVQDTPPKSGHRTFWP